MSIRHPEFCDLVDRLADRRYSMTVEDRGLLRDYVESEPGIEDQLDGLTVETVTEITGREDVWSPQRAARALLAVQHAA